MYPVRRMGNSRVNPVDILHIGDTAESAFIPPGTDRRGMNVFVNVLTAPGFTRHNECCIDRNITMRTGGCAARNGNLLYMKDCPNIEELM